MTMQKNTLAIMLLTLSLSACKGEKKTEYAGQYSLKSGNECSDTEASDGLFIEITKTREGEVYQAKMPTLAAQDLPILSNEAAPTSESLSFTFYKEAVSKLIGGSPAIELVVEVVPHPSSEHYLIVTEWYANVSRNTQTQRIDFFDEASADEAMSLYNTEQLMGLCIGK